jgi:hypothetical protein
MVLMQLALMFGQVKQQPQGGDGAGSALAMCACYAAILIPSIIVGILFLLTLSRTLAQCSPRNRTMEPGQVWLNLIPLFGLVWMFITVIRLSESLQNEYRSRGLHSDDPEFGKMTGILYLVLSLIPCVNIVGLVFFIMYWVKIAGYKTELTSRGRGGEFDDDDAPRRPRRRDDDDEYDDRRRDDEDDDRPRRRPRDDD